MMRKKAIVGIVVVALAMVMAMMVACSGSGSGSGQAANSGPQKVSADTKLEWNGYTMGVDLVTDDQDKIPSSIRDNFKGKAVKVCFCYISDKDDSEGFESKDILDELEENPIILKDGEGEEYEWSNSVGDISVKMNLSGGKLSMEGPMPRFSITFDVPKDTELEDLTLSTGEGPEVILTDFTSEAYTADHADSSDSSK